MPFKRARFFVALFVALCLLTFSLACGSDDDDEELAEDDAAEAQVALTPYKTTGNEGTVTGTVNFVGATPAAKPISMGADAVCESKNSNPVAEDIVVKEGGALQNVFVYVKDGKTADNKNINNLGFDVPAQPRVLDQSACQYVPHVIGIQVKQKLSITNSDPTSHNINLQATKNEKINPSQPPGAAPVEKIFQRSETLIPVKCNQHPWMKAYIGVLSHPFYAVSGPDGKFEITGLPPGTYTIVAWHEKFKQEQTQSVTVGAKESKEAAFKFAAEQMTAELHGGSLTVLPALEVPWLGHRH
jgi:hypothetical protein